MRPVLTTTSFEKVHRRVSPGLSRSAVFVILAIAWAALGLACSSDGSDDGRVQLQLRNAEGETARLRVEIADTAEERQVGLSGRDSLGRDEGMLFVLEQRLGFWMKDTRIPLSVAFIGACGEILELADMEPLSLVIHNTNRPYEFGLEVNAGWFDAHGIEVGDMVELPENLKPSTC